MQPWGRCLIIGPMRFLLLALLIALLPLRGWAGGAPAIEKIATQAQPTASTGQFDINSKPTHSDCHGHVDVALRMVSATAQDPVNQSHCPAQTSCGDCQMCHTLAVVATPVVPPVMPLPYEQPRAADTHFDSALSTLSLKPPIA